MESIFGKRGGAKQSYVTSHYLLISISSTDVALTVLRSDCYGYLQKYYSSGNKKHSALNFVSSVIKSIPLFLRYAKILMFGKVDYGL